MTYQANQEANPASQAWLTRAIALSNELVTTKQKLRNEMQNVERLHLTDLVSVLSQRAIQAEAQLEQVKQQKKLLQQQLQETIQAREACSQELLYTNKELTDVLKVERLTVKEAKEFAKTLVAEHESTRNALVQLLNAIYGSTIKPWELGRQAANLSLPNHSDAQTATSVEQRRFKAQFDYFSARFIALKSQLARLQEQYQNHQGNEKQ